LVKHALEAADKVRRWGDAVHIGPFSAFERRTIHQHFARDYELEAISEEGDEAGRKKMTIRVRQTPLTAPGQRNEGCCRRDSRHGRQGQPAAAGAIRARRCRSRTRRRPVFRQPGPGRNVTLIEAEAIEALERDCKLEITGADTRRNIVTRGVALNHLVGREFTWAKFDCAASSFASRAAILPNSLKKKFAKPSSTAAD